jgi:protoheme ferro-lyase
MRFGKKKRRTVMRKNVITRLLALSVCLLCGCSSQQDDTNFRAYLSQDLSVKGKAGVLITALGQPEDYDFTFFNNYLQQIFNAAFPWYIKPILLRDRGTVLLDPDNPVAEAEFVPRSLMDCYGKTEDADGTPYVEMDYTWVKPREEGKPGHFLLDAKNGYIDIVEKPSIKACAYYYGRMPGNKIPYVEQHEALFADVRSLLEHGFPGVPMRTAWAMYPATVKKAVDELIADKVDTIVVSDLFPVYSNLEQFAALFPEIEHMVAGRAKIIYAPQTGAFASYRAAFVQMAGDEIDKLPRDAKKILVLTRHGFPEMSGEPYFELAPSFYDNLHKEVESAIAASGTRVVFADTEFSADHDDPEDTRLSSAEILEQALEEQYDYIVYVLVDFVSENTDTVFCARDESLEPIGFSHGEQVPYADFTMPFRTELSHEGLTIIIAGTPVGPKYRPLMARGVMDAIGTALAAQPWPQLIAE